MKVWDTLAIVGVGLIGGSIGLAARERKIAKRVIGAGSRPESLQTALRVGAISEVAPDAVAAAKAADLIVIAAPVAQIAKLVGDLAAVSRPGTLITDAGSTKREIVELLERSAAKHAWPQGVTFIGSHPLAGNEKKGAQHSTAKLFEGRTVIVTPTASTPVDRVDEVTDFWTSLGARALKMSADEHDRALAATSHLPHLVAAALAAATPEEFVALTATGWQDTTRIAAGDPDLWRQIMIANREHLLTALVRFATKLNDWHDRLAAGDAAGLEQLLSEAKRIRDGAAN